MSIHFFFNSIFSKAPLFGVHLHIDAPVGFATSHASTCHVYSPSTTPSPDTTAIIVYNNAYTILHRDDYSFCPFTDISYSVSRCPPTSYGTRYTVRISSRRAVKYASHGAARAAAAARRRAYTACSVRATLRACTTVAVPASGRPDGAPLAGSLGVRDGSQADEWLTVTGINSAPATPRAGEVVTCEASTGKAFLLGFRWLSRTCRRCHAPGFTLGRGRYHTVARVCSAVRRHATACKLFGTSGVECVADDAVLMTGLPSAVGTDAVHRDCPGLRCDQQQYQFIACLKGQMYLQLERRVSVRRKPASSRPSHRGIAIEIHQGQVLFFFGSRYAHRPEIAKECTRVAGWVCAAGQRVIEYDETNSYEILEGWCN
jgi:hypothetical protein